jgi:hypothetical protein
MAGIPRDPSAPDGGWLMRVDALTFVRAAFNLNKREGERHLIIYACSDPSFEWRYQRRFNVKKTPPGQPSSPEKKRTRFPDFKEIDIAIRTEFWRMVLNGAGQAENNSATYAGLVFLAAPSARIGVNGKFETAQNVVLTDSSWWIEIELSLIQFAAAPLIASVRNAGGDVDAAIEKLRSLGRLPPAVAAAIDPIPTANPTPTPEPVPERGGTDQWVAEMLKRVSSKDYTQASYVDEVLVNRNSSVSRKTLLNSLSRLVREEPERWHGKAAQSTKVLPDARSAQAIKPAPRRAKEISRR